MIGSCVMTAGGFDPLHCGHLALFQAAKNLGGPLVVVVEDDDWVQTKRPLCMPQDDRVQIIRQLKCVDIAVYGFGRNGCGAAIENMRPKAFVVGPDHSDFTKIPEYETCQKVGTRIICTNELRKTRSSSKFIALASYNDRNLPVTVAALISGPDGVLICTRRSKDEANGQPELIGGFVDAGETLEQALKREIAEECGVELLSQRYLFSIVGTYVDGRKVLCAYFECKIDGPPKLSAEISGYEYVRSPRKLWSDCDTKALARYLCQT